MSNIQILHILKTHYLGKIHCPNTTPEPITGEVGLPIIKMYLLSVKKNQNNEATATFIKKTGYRFLFSILRTFGLGRRDWFILR